MSATISAAQQRAVKKYCDKHYDRFIVTVPKGEHARIKEAAEKAGVSTNMYVVDAIRARMNAE